MPRSFKHLNDGRDVIDNASGQVVPDVIEAQTSAISGQTYVQAVRRPDGSLRYGLLGGLKTRTVRADISIR